jgi:hypothetical protein
MPAEEVSLTIGQRLTIDFLVQGRPALPASVRLSATTPDENSNPLADAITAVDVSPPVQEAKVTIAEDGTAIVENLPAGTYEFIVKTTRGHRLARTVTLRNGEAGEINMVLSPVEPGGRASELPSAGKNSPKGRHTGLLFALALAGLAASAGVVAISAFQSRRPERDGHSTDS